MQIELPKFCPSCDSSLVLVNDVLYCKNTECGSVSQKRVEHFATTLKIKGLGPVAVEKLGLTSILEVYELDLAYIESSIGSEKLAIKLFEEIEQSKNKKLNEVLPALGIPLIGKTATDKLAAVCVKFSDITASTCKEAGLGPKATESLLNWIVENDWYTLLPHSLEFSSSKVINTASKGVVCITGKLTSFKTKLEAQTALEQLGFQVKSSLTKDVTILVNESGKVTAKTQKAIDSGITPVYDLHKFIGDLI